MENKLSERAFPLQNPELERTDLYTFYGDESKPSVLIGLRGPGGINYLWPVIEILEKENYPMDLLIDSVAKRIFKTKKSEFIEQPLESPLKRIMEIKPSIAVTEFSADGGVALPIEWSEQSFNIPTVCVEDFPGGTSDTSEFLRINPTYLCVLNETAKQMAIKKRPKMNPDNIIITGHPDFDKYHNIDKEKIRKETREKLGVEEEEFLVIYSGQLPPQTPDVLEHIIDSLNQVLTDKKLVLLFSRHPRDLTEEKIYEDILKRFNGKIVKQDKISSDEIGLSCDLLLTINSTEGLKSAFRRVPSVHILPQELLGEISEDGIPLPVLAGASTGVFSYTNLTQSLENSINDEGLRKQQLEKSVRGFKTDGLAASRVANVIKKASQRD